MTYTTVFDLTSNGYAAWWAPAFGLGFVAVGALLVFAPDLMLVLMRGDSQVKARPRFSWVFLGFAVFWTTTVFWMTFAEYTSGTAALRDGTASVVEGRVTDFVPMPYAGHAEEHITVAGRHFHYSDYTMDSSFHNTASHGGPMRDGLHVRISYLGNRILRLEIAE